MELLNYVMLCVNLFWRELAVAGAIMVSLIIAFMGIIKPLYNHIPSKELRKSALAFTSIVFSFIATAVFFCIRKGTNWELYWIASLFTSIACIVTYWLYENIPYLRDSVHKILCFIIDRVAKILKMIVNGSDSKEIKSEIKKATEELKATAKVELKAISKKTAKKDKELENL